MMQKRMMTVAAGAVLALGLSACSGGKTATTPTAAGGTADVANAAVNKVLRPSTTKGGTLRFGMPGDWDSVDPGDTYYGLSWNFLRNYARTLTVFKSTAGAPVVVPDLAETLGVPSDNALHLVEHRTRKMGRRRSNVRFPFGRETFYGKKTSPAVGLSRAAQS